VVLYHNARWSDSVRRAVSVSRRFTPSVIMEYSLSSLRIKAYRTGLAQRNPPRLMETLLRVRNFVKIVDLDADVATPTSCGAPISDVP
jgi:hypothetical protein